MGCIRRIEESGFSCFQQRQQDLDSQGHYSRHSSACQRFLSRVCPSPRHSTGLGATLENRSSKENDAFALRFLHAAALSLVGEDSQKQQAISRKRRRPLCFYSNRDRRRYPCLSWPQHHRHQHRLINYRRSLHRLVQVLECRVPVPRQIHLHFLYPDNAS